MKSQHLTAVVLAVLFAAGLPVMSQAQQSADTLRLETVHTKVGKRSIAKSKRITSEPRSAETTVKTPEVTYSVKNKQLTQPFNPEPIKAPRLKTPPMQKLYRAYAKAGLGNYRTSFADVFVSTLRSRENNLSARYRHLASTGELEDVGPNAFSQNRVDLFGKRYFKQHTLSGSAAYDRNIVHFYGFDPSEFDTISKDDIRQRLQRIEGQVEFRSFYRDSAKLNHQVTLDAYNLTDRYDATETNFKLNGRLNRFFNDEQFVLETDFDYNRFRTLTDTTKNAITSLSPQVVSRGNRWRLTLGLTAVSEIDTESKFYFYPNARFKYNVVGDLIIPYVGLTGGVTRNNFGTYTAENPFMTSDFELRNSNTKYRVYGGVRGAYSSTMSFNLQYEQSRVEDLPLYIVDSSQVANNRFTVAYDTVVVTHLSGQVSYQKGENLHLLLRGDYWAYDMTQEFEAWNRPRLKLTFTGRYKWRDKIVFEADVFGLSNRIAKSYDPNDDESYGSGVYGNRLKGFVDLNLGVEYRYTDRLAAFVKLNNLAATRYNQWYNYPSQGFNILGGLSYSFWSH